MSVFTFTNSNPQMLTESVYVFKLFNDCNKKVDGVSTKKTAVIGERLIGDEMMGRDQIASV